MKVKAWKFGEPESCIEVDVEDDGRCPWCEAAKHSTDGIIFVEVEKRGVHRCDVARGDTFVVVICEAVTVEEALEEIKACSA